MFQEGKDSVGVRLALGETQVVTETREFLIEQGICLDCFSQVARYNMSTLDFTEYNNILELELCT